MATSATGVTIDVSARIKGYEASLATFKKAVESIDPGSAMGKSLGKMISTYEHQIEDINKKSQVTLFSDKQIDSFFSKLNNVDQIAMDIGRNLMNLGVNDINFSNIQGQMQSVLADIQAAKVELQGLEQVRLTEILKDAPALMDSLRNLGVNLDTAGIKDVDKVLSSGIAKATSDINRYNGELKEAQNNLTALQKKQEERQGWAPAFVRSDDVYRKSLEDITNASKLRGSAIDTKAQALAQELSNNLAAALEATAKDGKIDAGLEAIGASIQKKIKDAFSTKDFSPEEFKKNLHEIIALIDNTKGIFKKDIFGAGVYGARENSYIQNLLNQFYNPDGLAEAQAKMQEIRTIFASQLSQDQLFQFDKSVNEGNLENAGKILINALSNIRKGFDNETQKTETAIEKYKTQIANLLERINTLEGSRTNLQATQSQFTGITADWQTQINNLTTRIEALEQQRNAVAEGTLKELGGTGSNAMTTASSNIEKAKNAAEQYHRELSQVVSTEKLLGNVQSLITRWFSVYGAVRLVRQAIKSMVKEITNLDKTINKISIVTNMSMDDLWSAIPQYTANAQKYGVAISGVYEVSQLYYQQGLKTAEVTQLTNETLKLAKISGLDYTTATNYMTNAVRSFKMEMSEAGTVADTYAALAAASASSVEELATAMSKTASSAQAVGSTMQETSAMMAVMIEATREAPENIGSAMKSIISRYGEMTSDPSKLVDSEGEAMSLNKVDKALQTVGITLQDSEGQFRSFTDVIVELAAKWDTLDSNTQRYIATVMAGNRQQSRFLALVSSGDRLNELIDVANESEGTGAIQTLKTMDSIESKAQNVQNALQSVYNTSGMQNMIKTWYDFETRVISTYAKLAEFSGANFIAKLVTQFVSLATAITTIFGVIRAKIVHSRKMMEIEETAAAQQGMNERVQLEQQEEAAESQSHVRRLRNRSTFERSKTGIAASGATDRSHLAQEEGVLALQRSNNIRTRGMIGGAVASLVGSGVSLYASQMTEETQAKRNLKGGLTIGGGILSAAGTGATFGAMTGTPQGIAIGAAIGGAIGLITSLGEAIGIFTETTEEKLERLNKAKEEASNENLIKQDNIKKLKAYKEQWDELNKTKNLNPESRQKWLDLNNEIVASYPELLSYIDAEGNSIAGMTTLYDDYYKAKLRASNVSIIGEAAANFELVSDWDQLYQGAGISSTENQEVRTSLFTGYSGTGTKNHFSWTTNGRNFLQSNYNKLLEGQMESKDIWISNSLGFNGVESPGELPNDRIKDIINHSWLKTIYDKNPDLINQMIETGQIKTRFGLRGSGTDLYLSDDVINALQTASAYTLNELSSGKTIPEIIAAVESGMTGIHKEYIAIATEFIQNEGSNLAGIMYAAKSRNNQLKSLQKYFRQLLENLAIDFNDELNELQLEVLSEYYTNNWIDWYAAHKDEYKNETNPVEAALKDYYQIVKGYQEEDKYTLLKNKEANEVYKNLNNYSRNQIQALGFDEEIEEILLKAWEDQFELTSESFISEMQKFKFVTPGSNKTYRWAKKFLENINDTFSIDTLTTILGTLTAIDTNENYSTLQKQNLNNAYMGIFSRIMDSNLSGEEKINLGNIVAKYNFASLGDVEAFEAELQELGYTPEKLGINTYLDILTSWLTENLPAEINTYVNNIITEVSDATEKLKKATQGMSLKELSEFADTIGIELTDSDILFKDGKYYFKDFKRIQEQVKLNSVSLTERLGKERDVARVLAEREGQLIEQWYNAGTVEEQQEILEGMGVSKEDARKYNDDLRKIYKAWDADKQDKTFSEYVTNYYTELENSTKVADNYYKDWIIRQAISANELRQVLELVGVKTPTHEMEQALAERNWNKLKSLGLGKETITQLQAYGDLLYETYEQIAKSVYDSAISSITSGPTTIKTTSANRALLSTLKAEDTQGRAISELTESEYAQISTAIVDLSTWSVPELRALQSQIEADESLSRPQKTSLITNIASSIDKQLPSKIFEIIASSYESMSTEAALQLAGLLDTSIDDLVNFGVLAYDELANTYSINLDELERQLLLNGQIKNAKAWSTLRTQAYAISKDKAFSDIIKDATSVNAETLANLAQALDIGYEELITRYFSDNGDGTYQIALRDLMTLIDTQYQGKIPQALQASLTELFDKTIDEIIKMPSSIGKGFTKTSEMSDYVDMLNDSGLFATNFTMLTGVNAVFEWNEALHAYTYSTAGLIAQLTYFYSNLENMSEDQRIAAEQLIKDNKRQLAENIDIVSYLGSERTDTDWNALYSAITQYNTYAAVVYAQAQQQQIIQAQEQLAAAKAMRDRVYAQGYNMDAAEDAVILAQQALAEVQTDSSVALLSIGEENLRGILEQGNLQALQIAQTIAQQAGKELSTSDLTTIYRAGTVKLVDTVNEQLTATVGDIVDARTAEILGQAGYTFDTSLQEQGLYVISSIGDLNEAYTAFLNALEETNTATLRELNNARANVLKTSKNWGNNEQTAIELLNKATSITYDEMAEVFTTLGWQFTEDNLAMLEQQNIIRRLGGDKLAITDWKTFASYAGYEPGSPQYTAALSAYNTALLKMNTEVEDAISSEISQFSSINRQTKAINLTYLSEALLDSIQEATFSDAFKRNIANVDIAHTHISIDEAEQIINTALIQYGGYIQDGLLQLTDDANILGIIRTITTTSQQYGVELGAQFDELNDAFTTILNNYISTIKNGINGTLSNVDASEMRDWARTLGVDNLDFTPTAKGLKLSEQSAIRLYNAIRAIDAVAAEDIFKDLVTDLQSSNTSLTKMSGVLQKIHSLNKQIAAATADGASAESERLSILNQELAVYEQMARQMQLSNPESYNLFESSGAYSGVQGFINFYSQFGTLQKTMNTAGENGYMSFVDFERWARGMTELAASTGQDIVSCGVTFDEAGQTYTKLMENASYSFSEDGTMIVDITSGFGLNFDATAALAQMDDNQDAITEYANQQVEMLDSLIAVLEVMAAMEELGDLDINQDNVLNLDELFIINASGQVEGYTEGLTTWAIELQEAAKENEQLKKFLEEFKVGNYNLMTILQGIQTGNTEMIAELGGKDGLKNIFNWLWQTADQIDYSDPTQVMTQLSTILSQNWELGEIPVEISYMGLTYYISKDGTKAVNSAQVEELAEQIATQEEEVTEEVRQRAIAALTTDENAARQEALKVNSNQDLLVDYLISQNVITRERTIVINGTSYSPDSDNYYNAILAASYLRQFTKDKTLEGIKVDNGTFYVPVELGDNIEYHVQINDDKTGVKLIYDQKPFDSEYELLQYYYNENYESNEGKKKDFRLDKTFLATMGVEYSITPTAATLKSLTDSETYQEIIDSALKGNTKGAIKKILDVGFTIDENTTQEQLEALLGIETKTVTVDAIPDNDLAAILADKEVTIIAHIAADGDTLYTVKTENGEDIPLEQYVASERLEEQQREEADGRTHVDIVEEVSVTSEEEQRDNIEGSNIVSVDSIEHDPLYYENKENERRAIELAAEYDRNLPIINSQSTQSKQEDSEKKRKQDEINANNHQAWLQIQQAPMAGTVNLALSNGAIGNIPIVTPSSLPLRQSQDSSLISQLATIITEGSNQTNIKEEAKENISEAQLQVYSSLQDLTELSTALKALGAATTADAVDSAINDVNAALDNLNPATAEQAIQLINDAMDDLDFSTAQAVVDTLNTKIQNIPAVKQTTIYLKITKSPDSNAKGTSIAPGSRSYSFAIAKGNAFASGKGTLMGELGPEMVVSGGHYYVVGQNGAEFVNLDPDAIVFNHLQTERLLNAGHSGRGKPITNEREATSWAKGNVSGPALAGASSALSTLKALRNMWKNIAEKGLSELAQQAGGGGGGGNKGDASYIADLERWYTLLREISRLEKDITYQETLRNKIESDRVIDGRAYYESQKASIELLNEEIAKKTELVMLQKEYYDARRAELEAGPYGGIFEFDEHGHMIYNDDYVFDNGLQGGLYALAELNKQNADDSAAYTAEEQYNMIISMDSRFEELLKYDTSGKEIDLSSDEGYVNAVQAFWDKADAIKEELDDLYDGAQENKEAILELNKQLNEQLQKIIDNEISVENRIEKAIEEQRQRVIDDAKSEKDAIQKSAEQFIKGLTDALDKERKMYEDTQSQNELNRMRRQLAILQRSGGSASQIRSLQQDIASREQDEYFNEQQNQIDAIQEASEAEIERLNHQIEIMEESLKYEKEHGLLWAEVRDIMDGTPEEIENFLLENSKDLESKSTLQIAEDLRTIRSEIEQWISYRDDTSNPLNASASYDWDNFFTAAKSAYQLNELTDAAQIAAAKAAYTTTYTSTKDESAASDAANAILMAAFGDRPGAHMAGLDTEKVMTTKATGGTQERKGWSIRELNAEGKEIGSKVYYGTLSQNEAIAKYQKIRQQTESTIKAIPLYKKGGLADFTGLAMVHGTPQDPEAFLNAEETHMWRDKILSGNSGSLTSMLVDFQDMVSGMVNSDSYSEIGVSSSGVNIENAVVNMNATISNDYDARRAADTVMEEMVRIARKTTAQQARR